MECKALDKWRKTGSKQIGTYKKVKDVFKKEFSQGDQSKDQLCFGAADLFVYLALPCYPQ